MADHHRENITTSFKEVSSMKPETEGKVKYGIWGLIVGYVLGRYKRMGWLITVIILILVYIFVRLGDV